ncbi:MAG: hypothetical protein QOE90_144 [Thermoplasmata archaeon]|jgi:hypothetical protein|nr:hypothetical protein [Thermoplasmata archaeon]
MARGRKALQTDTTPGKVLALALVANAPIALGFILAPLVTRDRTAGLVATPYVLWGTPLVALAAVVVYARASPERKAHRASRIGLLLAGVALLLWALVLVATLTHGAIGQSHQPGSPPSSAA